MLQHKGTQLLETSRLVLRKFTMDDAQNMFENWASDPEVTKFLTWPPHSSVMVTEQILKSWLDGYAQADFYQWAIAPKEGENIPIGSISVVARNDKAEIAHIGYCIGKRWWHRGFTSEALQAVINFLFDEVGMQRIETRHDPNNPHSGGVMRKCGMKYEGTLRRSDLNNQGICDACWYSILDDER